MKKFLAAHVCIFFFATAGRCQNVGVGIVIPIYPLHVVSTVSTSTGVFANSNAVGDALSGINTATNGSGQGAGVFGTTTQASLNAAGVYGSNSNANGTGISGVGNNIAGKALGVGSGGAFTGATVGMAGFASTAASGTGVVGAGNNVSPVTLNAGSGGAFTGLSTGVYSNVTGLSGGINQSIYTNNAPTGTAVAINAWNGALQYKILGNGNVSTIVKDLNNKQVIMYAPESPEDYFQDFGEGKLANGRAHIDIDRVLAKNIAVNEKHPLRVFIQPEGDCKGVYVTNKTANGFDVVELNGGTSNINFQWSITCNRADEQLANGLVSKNADARFSPMPDQLPTTEQPVQTGKKRNTY